MTDLEAEQMLAQLSEHYGEPVYPASTYCQRFRLWFKAIHDAVYRDEVRHLQEIAKAISIVSLAIDKSALLLRLIYDGEDELRTEKCPVHKGRWSGCAWDRLECFTDEYPQGCMSGSNVTGWLPTQKQLESQRKFHAAKSR